MKYVIFAEVPYELFLLHPLFIDFGRNHKAKLWSLEIVGELNNVPVKISLPAQVSYFVDKVFNIKT